MKIDCEANCDVIKDLLPLYEEGLLSEASVELVEDHLKTCSACKKEADTSINGAASLKGYENTEGSEETATRQADIENFKKIRKKISRGKIKGILLAILGSLIMAILLITYLTAPNYLPYDEERIGVIEGSDNNVYLEFGEDVAGYDINRYVNDGGDGYEYRITTWDNLWSSVFSRPTSSMIVLNPEDEAVSSVFYYTSDGQPDQLIYGNDPNPNGGSMTLPRLALNYYVTLAAFCFLLFLLFRKLFQKKPGLNGSLKSERCFSDPMS